jgi:hypothetical protein
MRRFGASLVGVVVAAGALLVPLDPGGADPVTALKYQIEIQISSILCNPATGEWQLTFGFKFGGDLASITFTSVVMADTGAQVVDTFSPNPFPSGTFTFGVANSPASLTVWGGGTVDLVADGDPGRFRFPSWTVPGVSCAENAALQVGPSVVASGATVTISGTGCLQPPVALNQSANAPGSPVGADVVLGPGVSATGTAPLSGTASGSVAFTPAVPFGPVTAAPDGTWSTTIVVPPGTPPGNYPVSATCSYPPISTGELSVPAVTLTSFAYRTASITIPRRGQPHRRTRPVVASPRFTG